MLEDPLELELWPFQLVPPTPSMLNSKGQVLVQTEVEKIFNITETCNLSCGPSEESVPEQSVSDTKERRDIQASDKIKGLNKFMTKSHFKMEGFHMLKDVLQRDDWMSSVDLKDAYFSVPIAQPHRKVLRFEWKGNIYEYQCLQSQI